jgi:predicted secreted acid phosphatase
MLLDMEAIRKTLEKQWQQREHENRELAAQSRKSGKLVVETDNARQNKQQATYLAKHL